MGSDDWRSQALCARVQDVDAAWVPADQGTHRTRRQIAAAMDICDACPVRDACLADAMVYAGADDLTIYGGLTRLQRLMLARMMAADHVSVRRVKEGSEQRFRQCRVWVQAHPDAIQRARRESKSYWSRYYSYVRKRDRVEPDRSLYLQPTLF